MPSISVVIPTYNHGRYVCDAISSVLAQTLTPLEVVVVDDGSTDDTADRVKIFGDKIRYVYQKNRGLSAARNTGIEAARGEWIALLDADDLWHPQKLERQWALKLAQPGLSLIGCECLTFTDSPPVADAAYTGSPRSQLITLQELVWGVSFGSGSGALIDRKCLDRVGLFDESLRAVEDLDLWLRIATKFSLAKVQEPLAWIRFRPTSMSMQAESMEANHRRVIEKSFSTLPELARRGYWRRVALARMYRGVAWMHYEARNRKEALRNLWRSFLACPLSSGTGRALLRLRMAVRFLLDRA